MILDTKESGMKHVVTKSQLAISLPSFDVVLHMLRKKALADSQRTDISQFGLDYSDAFRQVPVGPDELQLYCVTFIIYGKKAIFVFLEGRRG